MYDEVEPFDLMDDYRAASIAQLLYNINRDKASPALSMKDFVDAIHHEYHKNFESGEKKPQTAQQQFGLLNVLAAMHAGSVSAVPTVTEGLGLDPATTPVVTEDQIQAMLEKARKAMN